MPRVRRAVPTQIPAFNDDVADIATYAGGSMALTNSGRVYTFGDAKVTFAWKPRPDSGRDCLVCAIFIDKTAVTVLNETAVIVRDSRDCLACAVASDRTWRTTAGSPSTSSGFNVIPRRARPGLAGLRPHTGQSEGELAWRKCWWILTVAEAKTVRRWNTRGPQHVRAYISS